MNSLWDTGFSSINISYKGCSLLTVLKTNVWGGKKLKDTTLTYIPKIHTVRSRRYWALQCYCQLTIAT